MNRLYFDSSLNTFFDSKIHDVIPANALEITYEQHQIMLAFINEGGRIAINRDGFVFIPAPPDAYHKWNDVTQDWETDIDLQAEKLANWRADVAEITPKQLRLVLIENGINNESIEAAIASIADETTREVASIEWNYATSYQRNNENLILIATDLLGLDALKIDAMWIEALKK